VLMAGYGLQAVTMGLTGVAMLLGWPPVVAIAAAVAACCTLSITRPAHWAILPMLARTPQELTTANGVAGSFAGAGQLAGALGAAAILAFGPPGAVFAAAAVAAAGATALVVRLPVHGGGMVEHVHPAGDPEADREHIQDPAAADTDAGSLVRIRETLRALGGG